MLFLPREDNQSIMEYALILALIAVVVIAILILFGASIGQFFKQASGFQG